MLGTLLTTSVCLFGVFSYLFGARAEHQGQLRRERILLLLLAESRRGLDLVDAGVSVQGQVHLDLSRMEDDGLLRRRKEVQCVMGPQNYLYAVNIYSLTAKGRAIAHGLTISGDAEDVPYRTQGAIESSETHG